MTSKITFRRRLPVLIGSVFLLLVIAGIVMMIKSFLNTDQDKKPRVQQISLVKPPEPRPEPKPPEPEQKPPEVKEEVKVDEPPPPEPQAADAPPPGADLGVDANGSGSGDGFGLVGKKGGRDLLTIGGDGKFGGYLGTLQQSIRESLNRNDKVRSGEYRLMVKLWITRSGSIDRFELLNSSGNAEVDAAVKKELGSMKQAGGPPPEDMPQPVKLRISSR